APPPFPPAATAAERPSPVWKTRYSAGAAATGLAGVQAVSAAAVASAARTRATRRISPLSSALLQIVHLPDLRQLMQPSGYGSPPDNGNARPAARQTGGRAVGRIGYGSTVSPVR